MKIHTTHPFVPVVLTLMILFSIEVLSQTSIQILSPKPGSNVIAGTSITVTWVVQPLDVPVNIEFSSDSGSNWKILASNISGGKWIWTSVPNAFTNKCLIRISTEKLTGCGLKQWNSNKIIETNKQNDVLWLAWNPNNKDLLSVHSGYNNATVWNVITSKQSLLLTGHSSNLRSVICSPDSNKILTGGFDGSSIVWSARDGSIIQRIQDASNGLDYRVDWSKDGKYITTGFNGVTHMYNTTTYSAIRSYPSSYGGVHKQSPNSQLIAMGYYSGLHIINHVTGTSTIHHNCNATVNTISWSHDSKYVAVGTYDGTIEVIDAYTGQLVKTYNFQGMVNVNWHPSCYFLAAGVYSSSHDSTIVFNFLTDSTVISTNCGGMPEWNWEGSILALGKHNGDICLLNTDFGMQVERINAISGFTILPPCSDDITKTLSLKDMYKYGNAHETSSSILLTYDYQNQAGACWSKQKYDVSKGFTSTFQFRISKCNDNGIADGSEPGADGIAFVIQNDGVNMYYKAAENIGYDGIKNSIAIEYDTYNNKDTRKDKDGNHIAVQSNGVNPNSSYHAEPIMKGYTSNIPVISSGKIYFSKVIYDSKVSSLSIFLDESGMFNSPVLVIKDIDLSTLLKLDNGKAWVGFTGSTGTAIEEHEILGWTLTPCDGNTTEITSPSVQGQYETIEVFPNPSSGIVNIQLNVNMPANTTLIITDIKGEIIKTVHSGVLEKGSHYFQINGDNLPSGTYYYHLYMGTIIKTGIIIIFN